MKIHIMEGRVFVDGKPYVPEDKPQPEQTEAEKFLEKWKGKKIRLTGWQKDSYFIPERIVSDRGIMGVVYCERWPEGRCQEYYYSYDDRKWQLWEEPKKLEVPEDMDNLWSDPHVKHKINEILQYLRDKEAGE